MSRPKLNFKLLSITVIIFVVIIVSSIYTLQLKDFIITNNLIVDSFVKDNYLLVAFLSTILFIIIISCIGPVSPFVIIIGYYFSFLDAIVISFLSQIVGSIVVYSYSNYYFKEYFSKLINKNFSHLKSRFDNNSISFLIILRLAGGIPFSIQTIIVSIFGMSFKKFILANLIGIIPYIYIFTSVGNSMNSLIGTSDLGFNILMEKKYWIPVCLIIIIIIFNVYYKNKKNNFK